MKFLFFCYLEESNITTRASDDTIQRVEVMALAGECQEMFVAVAGGTVLPESQELLFLLVTPNNSFTIYISVCFI